jgi:hypothetical protein
MREVKIRVYSFNELSDQAKEKALMDLWDINVHYDWWDCVYSDASMVGLTIKGFDTGRASEVDLEFNTTAEITARLILKDHGESTDTHKLSTDFVNAIHLMDEESEEYHDACNEYLYDLAQEYLAMLRREYEYLTSEEAIKESIIANEYEFLETGKLY